MAGDVESGAPEGIVFESPDTVLPSEGLGAFGIEQILIRKHARPDRNAVITGALLWDNQKKEQYFVTSAELAALQAREPAAPPG